MDLNCIVLFYSFICNLIAPVILILSVVVNLIKIYFLLSQ